MEDTDDVYDEHTDDDDDTADVYDEDTDDDNDPGVAWHNSGHEETGEGGGRGWRTGGQYCTAYIPIFYIPLHCTVLPCTALVHYAVLY